MTDRDRNNRSENRDGKQEALDKNGVHTFAVQYYDAYTSETADEWELQDIKFANACWDLGFEMDCGNRFCETYGGCLGDVEHLERVIDRIDDPMALGCGIFSQWRYVTHWGYGDRLLDAKNRPWFIMAFRRLAALTGEPVPYREMPPSEPFKYVGPTLNTTTVTQQTEPVKGTSLFDAGYAYESGQGQAKCLTNALGIYKKGAEQGDQKCIEAIERLLPEGWSDDEIFLRHIREIGEDLHDLAEKLMKCATLLGVKTSYSNGPLGVYTTEVFNIAPRNRAHYEYVRLEHKVSKLSVKNRLSEKRVEDLFMAFKERYGLVDKLMSLKRGYVYIDLQVLTDDKALGAYLAIIREVARYHLKPGAEVPSVNELCETCGIAASDAGENGLGDISDDSNEDPGNETFSNDCALKGFELVSNNVCYGPMPGPEEEVEQHLLITADGNVELERYISGANVFPAEFKEKTSIHVSAKVIRDIMTAVRDCFGTGFRPCFITDVGTWYLTLVNVKGEVCYISGPLMEHGDDEDPTVELSTLIRQKLGIEDLFLFDGDVSVWDGPWYKEKSSDIIWWKDTPDIEGEFIFSFDKENEFNLFADYPWKLTPEQKLIFDEENPYWRDFFGDRTQE